MGTTGLVVKAEDSQLSGCGFESRHRILDGCERLQLKKHENKDNQTGHTKKKILSHCTFDEVIELDFWQGVRWRSDFVWKVGFTHQ